MKDIFCVVDDVAIELYIKEFKRIPREDLLDNRYWEGEKRQHTPDNHASPKKVRLLNENKIKVTRPAGAVYFSMKDYAYWAPIARRAKKNIEMVLELWDFFICPMLQLPKECNVTINTIDPTRVNSFLRGLACALMPHYYHEWYNEQTSSSPLYWLYSTLHKLSTNHGMKTIVPTLNTVIHMKTKYAQRVD